MISTLPLKTKKGFTLVELIVAVGLFAIVMFIATGALLTIVNLNKKSQAQQSAINNLSASMESMVRNIRTGTSYHCENGFWTEGDDYLQSHTVNAVDCAAPNTGNLLAFKSDDTTNPALPNPVIVYALDTTKNVVLRCREQVGNHCYFSAVTAPEIKIEFLSFDVQGTSNVDQIQASVRINLSGYAFVGTPGSGDPRRVNFALQTRATQRNLDI